LNSRPPTPRKTTAMLDSVTLFSFSRTGNRVRLSQTVSVLNVARCVRAVEVKS